MDSTVIVKKKKKRQLSQEEVTCLSPDTSSKSKFISHEDAIYIEKIVSSYESDNVSHETNLVRHRTEKRSAGQWRVNTDRSHSFKRPPVVEYDDVEMPGKGRPYTVSIAVPTSILAETCLKDELRTYVIGQLARAANIYSVDEIVIYDDGCWRNNDATGLNDERREFGDMMRILLEYQECPQYLRKHLFDYHPFLRKVGILNALNAPHHLLSNQWCQYREGVTLERTCKTGSYVDVGLSTEVVIDKRLQPGLRVTVKFQEESRMVRHPFGTVVSPEEPRATAGLYWGYTVRVANSLTSVLSESRFPSGYDLVIGTSDKGDDVRGVTFPSFSHSIIVFGGVEGLESAVEADDRLEASSPRELFDYYVNVCPMQQARTVRTEEAVLIAMCTLQEKLVTSGTPESGGC